MNKIMIKTGLLVAAMALATTAGARTPAGASATGGGSGEFSYNYVEGGVGELDHSGSAVFANGAMDVDRNWGLVGGVEQGSFDPSIDYTLLEAGAQFHQQQNSRLSLEAGAKLVYEHASGGTYCYPPGLGFGCYSLSESKTGVIFNGGLRYELQPHLQLEGDIKYNTNDVVKDGFGIQADLRYYIQPRLSLAGGLASDTELDGLFLGLRYDLR